MKKYASKRLTNSEENFLQTLAKKPAFPGELEEQHLEKFLTMGFIRANGFQYHLTSLGQVYVLQPR